MAVLHVAGVEGTAARGCRGALVHLDALVFALGHGARGDVGVDQARKVAALRRAGLQVMGGAHGAVAETSGDAQGDEGSHGGEAGHDQVHACFANEPHHEDVGAGGGEGGCVVRLDDVGTIGARDEGAGGRLVPFPRLKRRERMYIKYSQNAGEEEQREAKLAQSRCLQLPNSGEREDDEEDIQDNYRIGDGAVKLVDVDAAASLHVPGIPPPVDGYANHQCHQLTSEPL